MLRLMDSSYQVEIDYLVGCEKRNKFIKPSPFLKGNILILFQFVEKHGKLIYDIISSACHEEQKSFLSMVKCREKREMLSGLL